jgi:hypothetical protein
VWGVVEGFCMAEMAGIWLQLLTGNIGALCAQQLLKALRAPCGPISPI